jgi:PAS domain S-box-containing protein
VTTFRPIARPKSPFIGHLLENISDAFVVLDLEYRITYMNPAARELMRDEDGHLLGLPLWMVWPGAEDSELARRCRVATETIAAQHFDVRLTEQGSFQWLEIHAYPGKEGLAVSFRDVTAHKREQARLERVERAYKAALSNTPDMVFVFDREHRFVYANEALLALWGRTWDEAIGKTCQELGYPQWRAEWREREIEQVVATRLPVRGEGPYEGIHGTRTLEHILAPVIGLNGEVEAVVGTSRDITARKQAERENRDKRRRLAELFEQAPAFVAAFRGPDHVFEFSNRLHRELIGHRDVVGKPMREALSEAERPGAIERMDSVYRTGQPFTGHALPFKVVRGPGQPAELRFLNLVLQPMREADGTVSGIILLGVDITEAKRAEEALLRAEKLAVVGRMAASISHEINNPLAAVTNLLYLMQCDQTLTPSTRSFLETAQSELGRISHIAIQTLSFFRQSTNPVRTEIKVILDSAAALYERRLRSAEVTLERQYSTAEPVLVFDGELRQIVANLFANALDAVDAGGRMVLRERLATDWPSGRRGIKITLADSGHGMSRETMHCIFDPFFSTKGGTGTGLGLWVARQMAEKRGGKIRVRSSQREPGRGAVFSVFLPEMDS